MKRIIYVEINSSDEDIERIIDELILEGASSIRVETDGRVKLVTSIEAL